MFKKTNTDSLITVEDEGFSMNWGGGVNHSALLEKQ